MPQETNIYVSVRRQSTLGEGILLLSVHGNIILLVLIALSAVACGYWLVQERIAFLQREIMLIEDTMLAMQLERATLLASMIDKYK